MAPGKELHAQCQVLIYVGLRRAVDPCKKRNKFGLIGLKYVNFDSFESPPYPHITIIEKIESLLNIILS